MPFNPLWRPKIEKKYSRIDDGNSLNLRKVSIFFGKLEKPMASTISANSRQGVNRLLVPFYAIDFLAGRIQR